MIASATSCLEPTQITVRVETDIPCGPGGEGELADVLVGAGGGTVGDVQLQGACTKGLVGTATIVPGKKADVVDITVVGSIGTTKCTIDSLNEGGCIVAKRRLSFIDHYSAEITVRLDAACAGLDCGDGTCSDGKCVPKTCTTDCTSDGGTTVDAGPPPVISSLTAGGNSTCVILSSGDVECWGESNNGKLFANGPIKPTAVPALFGAKAIALGRNHGCGIFPEGSGATVKCWGANDKYQAGAKAIGVDVTTPTGVLDNQGVPLANATAIAAGDDFTCAVASDGRVLCWGDGSLAQLGTTKPGGTPSAIPVANVANAVAVAAGTTHACARATFAGTSVLCTNGACGVVCWGSNSSGQCAGANIDPVVSPRGIPLKSDLLAAGGERTIDLLAGDVYYWGASVGALPQTGIPAKPVALPKAIAASTGIDHACLVTANGNRPFCLPSDGNFSAGLSGIVNKFTSVVSGWKHACGLTANGSVWCWGGNDQWQLGAKDAKSPNRVNGL